jgi:hypothetical protein
MKESPPERGAAQAQPRRWASIGESVGFTRTSTDPTTDCSTPSASTSVFAGK